MNFNFHRKLIQNVSTFLADHPISSLLLGVVGLAIIIPGFLKLQSDFSYRTWFNERDPLLQQFDAFQDRFGNDDSFVLIVHSESGVFDSDTVSLLQEMTKKASLIEGISRVDSLINYEWVHSDDNEIVIEPFLEEKNPTPAELKRKKEIALKNENFVNYLISRDTYSAVIHATLNDQEGTRPSDPEMVKDFRELIQVFEGHSDHRFYLTGSIPVANSFAEVNDQDLKLLIPLVIGLICIFLFVTFKRIGGIVLPLALILISVFSTLSMGGWLQVKINNLTSLVPIVLISISVADAVHLLMNFFHLHSNGIEQRDATRITLIKNLKPTFLTSLTTALGFFSFITADVAAIAQLGFLAGVGTMLTWIVSILLIVPCMALIPFPKKIQKVGGKTGKLPEISSAWVARLRLPIIFFFLISAAIAFTYGLGSKVNTDPLGYFTEEVPVTKATRFMEKNIGGAMGVEIILETGLSDGVKSPEFLMKVDTLQKWIDQKPFVSKTVSIVNVLKQTNRSLNGDRQSFYSIPETRDAVAQQLLLYSLSLAEGRSLSDRITLEHDATRVSVFWTLHDAEASLQEMNNIKEKMKSLGLHGYLTGKMSLYQGLNEYVVKAFVVSILLAVLTISLIMSLSLGSIRLGILAMIPNLIPVIFSAGLLRLLDHPIDIGTVLVGSICLGIGVDDTVHFLSDYCHYLKQGSTIPEAIQKVFSSTAPALVATTVILSSGFCSLMFASFVPNAYFGALTALVLLTALAADLLFLPALLLQMMQMSRNKTAAAP